jgi:hypothetical protein
MSDKLFKLSNLIVLSGNQIFKVPISSTRRDFIVPTSNRQFRNVPSYFTVDFFLLFRRDWLFSHVVFLLDLVLGNFADKTHLALESIMRFFQLALLDC